MVLNLPTADPHLMAVLRSGQAYALLEIVSQEGMVIILVRSHATITATAKTPQNIKSQPTNFHEAIAVALYTDRRDKERRAKSVVVTGLPPCSDKSDGTIFSQLCSSEFGVNPQVTYTRRLGTKRSDTSSRCLSDCSPLTDVSLIMSHAKSLRRSLVQLVRENVFINRNLTKIECRLAYEERCRRRQWRQIQMNAAANSHQADESVSFVSNSTSTQPIAVLNTLWWWRNNSSKRHSAAIEPISNDLPTDSDRDLRLV